MMQHPIHVGGRRLMQVRRASSLVLIGVFIAMCAATGFAALLAAARAAGAM